MRPRQSPVEERAPCAPLQPRPREGCQTGSVPKGPFDPPGPGLVICPGSSRTQGCPQTQHQTHQGLCLSSTGLRCMGFWAGVLTPSWACPSLGMGTRHGHSGARPQCRGRQLPGAEARTRLSREPSSCWRWAWGWLWPLALMMLTIQRGPRDLAPAPGHPGLCGHRRKHWPDGLQGWRTPLSVVLTRVFPAGSHLPVG